MRKSERQGVKRISRVRRAKTFLPQIHADRRRLGQRCGNCLHFCERVRQQHGIADFAGVPRHAGPGGDTEKSKSSPQRPLSNSGGHRELQKLKSKTSRPKTFDTEEQRQQRNLKGGKQKPHSQTFFFLNPPCLRVSVVNPLWVWRDNSTDIPLSFEEFAIQDGCAGGAANGVVGKYGEFPVKDIAGA
jgi:hypothetical protein